MIRHSKKLLFVSLPIFIVILFVVVGRMALVRAAETAAIQPANPSSKIVHGHVATNLEERVANALVIAHRVELDERVQTLTGADGAYELSLSAGLWAVTVEPISSTVPGNWVYPYEPQHVEFRHNDEPESHELNFTVIAADAAVTGGVEMPDGSVPPFPVIVSLRNGEGLGGQTRIDPATGKFELALPHGRYKIIVHPQHDGYAGPDLEPVHLPPGETVDLGTITLIARNAHITGMVTDQHGAGVEGIPVTAWQRGRPHMLSTRTVTNGLYALAVTSGTWHIQPAPGPDLPYIYRGEGETVQIGAGETISDVNFEVLAADATIAGILVTEDGAPIGDVAGWATAVNTNYPDIHNGAPIREGQFAIHVLAGDYLVSLRLPPGSPYFTPGEVPASVASGETVTLTIPLKEKDAYITGALVDPRQDHSPVTGVQGTVSARSGDHWATTHIRPDSGTYNLAVTAGVWHLTYDIDDEDYVKLGGAYNIPVQAGQTVQWPLPVTRKDAAMAGQVLAPNGDPVPGAVVIAQGLVGDIHGLRLRTRTDDSGHFRLRLPHGRYRVGATGGEPGWINPVERIVGVGPDMVVDGIVLQFLEPNARLSGDLTVLNTTAEGDVLVWAWSERGGFTKGHFPVAQTDPGGQATGVYHLGVMSGTTWHVGAIFETDDAFWVGRGAVEVTGTVATLNLELSGPHPKPPPVVVTFDAGQAQRLALADGTQIFIPAGAMPVEGRVTLRIVPIATLPHQGHAHIIRYGYAFFATDEWGQPIEAHFNHNVLIRFPYDESDLNGRGDHLKPAYFSTTTNEWTFPEHYVVHPERNVVTMEIDHFTDFALVEGPVPAEVFLPTVMR